ncbi:MAG: SIS domain-containing protein [Terriglobia bacterium]
MTELMDEILQQPTVLAGVRKYYASPGAISIKGLRSLVNRWPPLVVFTGMGSSLFASYPAQACLTALGVRALTWETAELLHHHLKILGPDTLLVVISQSGETIEVRKLLQALPKNIGVLAVVNVESSTLARRANLMLPMMAGLQSGVSTKTYMCSVAVLIYLALAIAQQDHHAVNQALRQVIEAQERILDRAAEVARPTVEFFNHPTYAALMARGADLATAHQGALMLKEIARLGAEAISAAQFRHGPLEMINTAHRYIIIARKDYLRPRGRATTTKFLLHLAEDIRSHGGRALLLTDMPAKEALNMQIIQVETAKLGLGTLVDSLHLQLLAYGLAVRSGIEPGKFWIAQEVTRAE